MLLVALPILSAYGEPEPLMEDPFGMIGAAPTPGGGQLRNQQVRSEKDQNIIAVGLGHRLGSAGLIMASAAGAGIGDDSPRFLVFASLKWLLGTAAP